MRSKLNFLINVSLKKKIKSKWFLVANIIVALLLIAVINIVLLLYLEEILTLNKLFMF